MTMIQLIACIGMIAGLFMVLGISPAEMSDSIFPADFRPRQHPGGYQRDDQAKKGRLLPPGDHRGAGGAGRIRA